MLIQNPNGRKGLSPWSTHLQRGRTTKHSSNRERAGDITPRYVTVIITVRTRLPQNEKVYRRHKQFDGALQKQRVVSPLSKFSIGIASQADLIMGVNFSQFNFVTVPLKFHFKRGVVCLC